MRTRQKFQTFQDTYDEAVDTIERFLANEVDGYTPRMDGLVRWMMETDANPYGYLDWGWGGSLESAEKFAALLHHLHHALYDDGDVTFCTVDGEPRIIFANHHDDGFREKALHPQERDNEAKNITNPRRPGWVFRYDVRALDITPSEFGPLYDAYHTAWIKQCFMHDSRNDLEGNAKHYRKYQQFDESWVEEARQKHAERALPKEAT